MYVALFMFNCMAKGWEDKVSYFENEVKHMMKAAKRRLVPNSSNQVWNFLATTVVSGE
jgi:hypothetical protein